MKKADWTPRQRMSRARFALMSYYLHDANSPARIFENEIETTIVDLLADLKHLCEQKDIDWLNALRLADLHFNHERKSDEV